MITGTFVEGKDESKQQLGAYKEWLKYSIKQTGKLTIPENHPS